MRLETSRDQLRSIIAPFDAAGADISILIEDLDGGVVTSAGVVDADETSDGVRREIAVAGEVIGHVVGRGAVRQALIEAIAASVARSASALAASALAAMSSSPTLGSDHDVAHVRLEAELALARKIQRSFVPLVPPDIPGYEVATHYAAAREVGGDFFEVFRLRGRTGRLAISIADVTGKGIAAAILMAFTRPLLHAAIDNAATPGEALERANRVLVNELRSSLFVTALCAVVDLRSGNLRLANAGHEPPLHVPAGDGPINWLETSGPLLGAFAQLDLAECSIVLAPGDLVLLYTDGVTDTQAPNGERFGDDRLIEAVRVSRGGTAADVVAAVRDACHEFQGEAAAADDVAIVAIRRNPSRRRTGPARGSSRASAPASSRA